MNQKHMSIAIFLFIMMLIACSKQEVAVLVPQPTDLSAAPNDTVLTEALIKIVPAASKLGSTSVPAITPTPEPTPGPTRTPEPTPEPTPSSTPEPMTISAWALVDEAGVVGRTFSLGAKVEVGSEQDGYYVIETDDGDLLVEKWLVRMESEKSPKAYTAYAKSNANIYIDPYFEDERIATLKTNTKLTVEDSFGEIVRVTLNDGSEGYALASSISKSKISSGGGSGSQDGGDIPIGNFYSSEVSIVSLGSLTQSAGKTFTPCKGTILAEGAEAYIAMFDRGDKVQVLEKNKPTCTVLVGEKTGTIPTKLLSFEGDKSYSPWDGFAKANAPFHKQYRMLDTETKLSQNTKIRVIGEIEGTYIVEVKDQLGYMPAEQVSETKITSSGKPDGGWTDPVL